MGCVKLHILDQQYKNTELKVSCVKKELTLKNSAVNGRKAILVRYIDPDGKRGEDTSGKPAGAPKLNPNTFKVEGKHTSAQSSVYAPKVQKKENIPITINRALMIAQKRPRETVTRTKSYTEKRYEALSDFEKSAVNNPVVKAVATGGLVTMAAVATPTVTAVASETAAATSNAAKVGVNIISKTATTVLSNPVAYTGLTVAAGAVSGAGYSLMTGEMQDVPQISTGLPLFDNAFVTGQTLMTLDAFLKTVSFDTNQNTTTTTNTNTINNSTNNNEQRNP